MTCSVSHETSHRNALPYSLTNACRTHVRVTNGCVVSWSCSGAVDSGQMSSSPGWSCMSSRKETQQATSESFSVLCPLSATTTVCLLLCAPLLFWSFFCASVLPQQGLIWPHVLDLMSSWPSGISRFASSINPCSRLTRFGDFTRLCLKKKKEVISAAVWIRSWVERDHIGPARSLLAWFLESL